MKITRGQTILLALGLVMGIGFVLAAVFADQLGLDPDGKWGPSRWFLLEVGVSISILCSVLLGLGRIGPLGPRLSGSPVAREIRRLRESVRDSWHGFLESHPHWASRLRSAGVLTGRGASWLRSIPPVAWLLASPARLAGVSATAISIAVVLVYLWIVSVGRWVDWPTTTDYYDALATAFLHGQLHLLVEPDPRLLALPDPYQIEMRGGITYPWDMVLFHGKYYMYWGPTPGVILAAAKAVLGVKLGDPALVLGTVAGAYLAGALLLLVLWRRFYPTVPWWAATLPLMVLGLANPMPWLLNRPAVYEAAIGSGQLFVLLGLLLAVTGLFDERPVRWRLAAAGVCWAAAVGSRPSLAVVVIFLAAAAAIRIVAPSLRASRARLDLGSLAALFVPLVVGALLIGGYNEARFGSPFQFGHRYQLGRWNKNTQYERVFSTAYVFPNLYNYLFNRLRSLPVFPFVKPTWGTLVIVPLHMIVPSPYHPEQVTGLLVSTPFAIYAVVSLILFWRTLGRRRAGRGIASGEGPATSPSLTWAHLTLAGGVVFSFAPLVAFVSVTQRHLADLVPLLIVLASLGFWQAHQALAGRPSLRRAHAILVFLLIAYSAATGFLLAVTGYQARFEHLNPELFDRITRLLAW